MVAAAWVGYGVVPCAARRSFKWPEGVVRPSGGLAGASCLAYALSVPAEGRSRATGAHVRVAATLGSGRSLRGPRIGPGGFSSNSGLGGLAPIRFT